MSRSQAKQAIEKLKQERGIASANHGRKILSNGDVLDANTGEVIGDLLEP